MQDRRFRRAYRHLRAPPSSCSVLRRVSASKDRHFYAHRRPTKGLRAEDPSQYFTMNPSARIPTSDRCFPARHVRVDYVKRDTSRTARTTRRAARNPFLRPRSRCAGYHGVATACRVTSATKRVHQSGSRFARLTRVPTRRVTKAARAKKSARRDTTCGGSCEVVPHGGGT